MSRRRTKRVKRSIEKTGKKHNPSARSHFASDLEFAMWKILKKRTKTFLYESDRLPFVLEKTYIPDFVVNKSDGSKMYIEIKGYFRATDRTKLLGVKKLNPKLDIRMVFAKNNKISSKSNSRYGDWCDRHGIPYAVGTVPKEWFANEQRKPTPVAGISNIFDPPSTQ